MDNLLAQFRSILGILTLASILQAHAQAAGASANPAAGPPSQGSVPMPPPGYQIHPTLAGRYGLVPSGVVPASASAESPEEQLKQGLWEEEANRNPTAAIPHYRKLMQEYDARRQSAATALFRLAECYRKLGFTNDAGPLYQRLIRDFSEHKDLVGLSMQNLAILGLDSKVIVEPQVDPVTGQQNIPNPNNAVQPQSGSRSVVPESWQLLDPQERPELERKLAFLETKRTQNSGDETFATAVRIVFPNDDVLRKADEMIASIRRRIAQERVHWEKAIEDHRQRSRELATATSELETVKLKFAPTGVPGSNPEDVQLYNAALKKVGDLNARVKSLAEIPGQADYNNRLLALREKHREERLAQLVRIMKLRIALLKTIEHTATGEPRLAAILQEIQKAQDPFDRSELIRMALPDEKATSLRVSVVSIESQLRDLQAVGSSEALVQSMKALEANLAGNVQALRDREAEVERTASLQLELLRSK